MLKYYIYGITKDDGFYDDPDEAIDIYHYHKVVDGTHLGNVQAPRQYVVDRIKANDAIAFTFRNGQIGAKCEVKVSRTGVEYLKTVPNGNPLDNLSSLPEM